MAPEQRVTPAGQRRRVARERPRGPDAVRPRKARQIRPGGLRVDRGRAALRIDVRVRERRMRPLRGLEREPGASGAEDVAAHRGRDRLARGPAQDDAGEREAGVRVLGLVGARAGRRRRRERLPRGDRPVRVAEHRDEVAVRRVAEARRVAEQIADGRAGVASPAREPAPDRVVEAQAARLDQAHRQRRGRDLRDAVERDRGPRRHRRARAQDGGARGAGPFAPIGEHDRRRDAGDERLLHAGAQPRVQRAGELWRQARPRRRVRPLGATAAAAAARRQGKHGRRCKPPRTPAHGATLRRTRPAAALTVSARRTRWRRARPRARRSCCAGRGSG